MPTRDSAARGRELGEGSRATSDASELSSYDLVDAGVPRMREKARFEATVDLVALPTAVSVARMFISNTLTQWRALFIEDHVVAVAVELVALSVAQTGGSGPPKPIILRMLGYQRYLVFEVNDVHTERLARLPEAGVPVNSGLGVVDRLAERWGSSLSSLGRVNWAELAVYRRTEAGLPQRDPLRSSPAGVLTRSADPELLRRVAEGISLL